MTVTPGLLAETIVHHRGELASRLADAERAEALRRRVRSLEARRSALANRLPPPPPGLWQAPGEAVLQAMQRLERAAARGDTARMPELSDALTLALVDEELAHVRADLQAAQARLKALTPPRELQLDIERRREELRRRVGEGRMGLLDDAAAEAATWARARTDLEVALAAVRDARGAAEELAAATRATASRWGHPNPLGPDHFLRRLAAAMQVLDASPVVDPPAHGRGRGEAARARAARAGWGRLAEALPQGPHPGLPAEEALRALDDRLAGLQASLAVRLRRATEAAEAWRRHARAIVESL